MIVISHLSRVSESCDYCTSRAVYEVITSDAMCHLICGLCKTSQTLLTAKNTFKERTADEWQKEREERQQQNRKHKL